MNILDDKVKLLNHPDLAGQRNVPSIAEDTAVLFSTTSPLESHEVSDHEEGDDIREKGTNYRRFSMPDGPTIAACLEKFEPPLKAGFKDLEETAADAEPPPDSEAGTAPGGAPARPQKRRDRGADSGHKRRKKALGTRKGAGGSESAPPAAAVSSAAGVSNLSVCTLILL